RDVDEDHIDMRPLLRIGAWGVGAAVALSAAVFAGRTETGEQRAGVALAALMRSPAEWAVRPTNVMAARPAEPDAETRQLAETVKSLTADRDRLASRVATLEHSLNDLTGSVSRAAPGEAPREGQREAPRASSGAAPAFPPMSSMDEKADSAPPAPAADTAAPAARTPAAQTPAAQTPVAQAPTPATRTMVASASEPPASTADQSGVGLPANVPLPRPGPLAQIQSYVTSSTNTSPPDAAAETRVAEAPAAPSGAPSGAPALAAAVPTAEGPSKLFAVDLASATNVNALRARWGTIRGAHAQLLDGLRPLVSVRDSKRPGFTEFHLVAGPVADAAEVDRLCAALAAARAPCQPAVFDGQRLDLR
ncbi:MAG TPA: hypothetical protein VGH49_14755, partial [Xanthobacteraceae bacterium]